MSGKSFSDGDIALRMRDFIERTVRSVLDKERPQPFVAEVTSINIFTNKCRVMVAGMTNIEDAFEVNFTDPLNPNTARTVDGLVRGNIVLVEKKNSSLWITQIYDGEYRLGKGSRIVDPRFNGGDFSHVETESNYFVEMGAVPTVGNTQLIGRWDNAGKTLWSDCSFILEVDLNIELFTNQKKTYRHMAPQQDRDNVWRTILPVAESGVVNNLDYALEIRMDNTGFELRVRYLRATSSGTGGFFARIKVIGNQFTQDLTNRNLETADPRPTQIAGATRYDSSENNGNVNQGPYHSGVRHLVETRQHNNLLVPSLLTWNGQELRWSGSWRVIGLGKGELSNLGYLNIDMPAIGTSVAVHGKTGVTSIAVTSAGFPLSTITVGAVLYYEPQYFANGSSVDSRFHILAGELPFKVPSHWIMVAAMNPVPADGNSLLLGNGTTTDHWRAVTFQNAWGNYSTTTAFDACAYRKIGSKVETMGLAAGGTLNATIFTLPVSFRPLKTKIMNSAGSFTNTGAASTGTAHTHAIAFTRVDFVNNGTVVGITQASNGYLSLENISFEAGQ